MFSGSPLSSTPISAFRVPATPLVTGLSVAGSVGLVIVPEWYVVDPEDGSGWGEITPTHSPNWSEGSISN